VHRIKKDRRQKETQRKQKAAECRKHLTNIRFVVYLCRGNNRLLFLPRDASAERGYEIACRPSVCPSVRNV